VNVLTRAQFRRRQELDAVFGKILYGGVFRFVCRTERRHGLNLTAFSVPGLHTGPTL
jgi:hypothetical protein